MITRELHWTWQGTPISLAMDEAGEGQTVVLLPALSSISTRSEMWPLFEVLLARFRAVTVDWPGFGDRPRPRIDWTPDILSGFLDWLLCEILPAPYAIITAGHAATYALYHLVRHAGATHRLALIAPTWRGPFPTMMGGLRPWFSKVREVVDAPLIGSALYGLNLSGPIVRKMVGEHVYSDPAWLTPDRALTKRRVTTAGGARHASVRFVTGALDRVLDRASFIELARTAGVPILLLYGEETPPKSRAEMDALSSVPGIETVRLRRGRLGIHEEFSDQVAREILAFLD